MFPWGWANLGSSLGLFLLCKNLDIRTQLVGYKFHYCRCILDHIDILHDIRLQGRISPPWGHHNQADIRSYMLCRWHDQDTWELKLGIRLWVITHQEMNPSPYCYSISFLWINIISSGIQQKQICKTHWWQQSIRKVHKPPWIWSPDYIPVNIWPYSDCVQWFSEQWQFYPDIFDGSSEQCI